MLIFPNKKIWSSQGRDFCRLSCPAFKGRILYLLCSQRGKVLLTPFGGYKCLDLTTGHFQGIPSIPEMTHSVTRSSEFHRRMQGSFSYQVFAEEWHQIWGLLLSCLEKKSNGYFSCPLHSISNGSASMLCMGSGLLFGTKLEVIL